MVIAVGEWRIGPGEGKGSGHQQDNTAECFDVQETLKGGKGALGNALRARQGILLGKRLVHGHPYLSRGGPTIALPVVCEMQREHPVRILHRRRMSCNSSHIAEFSCRFIAMLRIGAHRKHVCTYVVQKMNLHRIGATFSCPANPGKPAWHL